MKAPILAFLVMLGLSSIAYAQNYDLVINNGRVIDPETKLDAIRNVGIKDGKIAAITTGALSGTKAIDATGLIVSPGFIDLHSHGVDLPGNRMQAFDGVTTALPLRSMAGTRPSKSWAGINVTLRIASGAGPDLRGRALSGRQRNPVDRRRRDEHRS